MAKSSTERQAEIAGSWRQQLASILRTGQLLREAKSSLKHGEWLKLLSDGLPFKELGRVCGQRRSGESG